MHNRRARWVRRAALVTGWLLTHLLVRFELHGREHLQVEGPVLYTGNHAGTLDALLAMMLVPPETAYVTAGDFELLWPANWFIRWVGAIPVRRGSVDREALKRMLDALQDGGRLAIFPEGGSWEKPIHEVKSGATYLSHATGARIVPIGLGGTYRAWDKIVRLRFPRITVNIGAPLPPVAVSGDRRTRQDELQAAAVELMQTIYNLLPAEEQARYDQLARQRFSGCLVFKPEGIRPPEVSFDALAELVAKPNLFSPLRHNARLPVAPLATGRMVSPRRMKRAVEALRAAFSAGDFSGFLEYRLGDSKAAEIRAALAAMIPVLDEAEAAGARVAFVTRVTEVPAGSEAKTEQT